MSTPEQYNVAYNKTKEHRKRANRLGLRSDFSAGDWIKLVRVFDYRCAYCKRSFYRKRGLGLSLDHIVPLCDPDSPGTIKGNVICACQTCNNSKHEQDIVTFVYSQQPPEQAAATLARIERYMSKID
jgi:5-methylcytosine-specific restriction endonuclease McrA